MGIEIRCIRNKPVKVFNPDGTLLCETDNELQFNDILIQIMEQRLTGYYIKFKGKRRNIEPSGTVKHPPSGFFDIMNEQLRKLTGF